MEEKLQIEDVKRLQVIVLALAKGQNYEQLFPFWMEQADIPEQWIQSLGKWPSDTRIAAHKLITSLYDRGINNNDKKFNALGSVLNFLMSEEVGIDKASVIAAVMVRYNLVKDKQLLNELIIKYQVPLPPQASAALQQNYGPEIDWQEPVEELHLQGWSNSDPGFLDVGFLMKGIQQSVSVCRIETLAGDALGTGFLVDENLLLTNHHVLQAANIASDDIQSNAQNILLRFGYFGSQTGRVTEGQTFRLDQNQPVVQFSPTEKLDYALLRVEDKISEANDIKNAECDFQSFPSKGMGLTILQHPEGESMKLAVSRDGVTTILQESGLVQYVTRTAGGSSGSPCFNEDWKVVALHHAERSRAFGSIREGILLSSIYQDLDPEIKSSLGKTR